MSIIARVIDIKNSIALVQYEDKRIGHIQSYLLSQVLIDKYNEEIKEESQVE